MAEVVNETQQEFWRPPVALDNAVEVPVVPVAPALAEVCPRCATEFMIGSRFCHTCGACRPDKDAVAVPSAAAAARSFVAARLAWIQSSSVALYKRRAQFPSWLHYLHFHEIKGWIGLPTPSLIAFILGVGCILGALGVSVFYRASNLAEFQAIQMWRIEWLLAATASFAAGILLKRPAGKDE